MKVVLSSVNEAKVEAVRRVVFRLFGDCEVVGLKVETGVSATPTTDEEGIEGALNRIGNAMEVDGDADVYVGLEGIVTRNSFGTFLCGWAVLRDRDGREAYGCSAKVRLPSFIGDSVEGFRELSDIVKENYPSDLVGEMSVLGSNGVITEGLYTRVDEFEDALLCAFGYLGNEVNFR